MASVNKVILIGNLGRDPEVRYMPSGEAVTNITIATTESWKDKNTGEKRDATEWHRVVFFRKLAEIAGQYLKKGSQVYIEGSLKTRKYQKDGVDHYATEIVADEMRMLGSRQGAGDGAREYGNEGGYGAGSGGGGGGNYGNRQAQAPSQPAARPSAPPQSNNFNDLEDDIPF